MAIPVVSRFTVFNLITVSTTIELHTLSGLNTMAFAHSVLLEVVGASTPNWTLAIQGKSHENGTYANWDYIEIAKAGASALSNSTLTVNDATTRYYLVLNCPPFLQLVATRTGGSLTVRGTLTSEQRSQWLPTSSTGAAFVGGEIAHDGVDSGNPVKIGGKAATGNPTAVANADRVDAHFTEQGDMGVFLVQRNTNTTPVFSDSSADGKGTANNGLMVMAYPLALAPDGLHDRLRSLGNLAGAGLGVLCVSPATPGSSDVLGTTVDIGATSAARATALTPTAGKKIRIVSLAVSQYNLTTDPGRIGVYFGTGAAYTTTIANAITEFSLRAIINGVSLAGGDMRVMYGSDGPVGAADAVVSWLTEVETETGLRLTIQYREE